MHGLRTLSIQLSFGGEEGEECGEKALIQLIGRPLTSLTLRLENSDLFFEESYLEAILASCPNLVTLDISNLRVGSLTTIADFYTLGKCAVTTLSLTHCMVEDRESLQSFANDLADPNTAISKILQELRLSFARPRDTVLNDQVMAFLTMFDSNFRLKFFALAAPVDPVLRFRWKSQVLNGRATHARRGPLATVSKYAFLNVMYHHQHQDDDGNSHPERANARMDSFVLASIFEMAAETHTLTLMLHQAF